MHTGLVMSDEAGVFSALHEREIGRRKCIVY